MRTRSQCELCGGQDAFKLKCDPSTQSLILSRGRLASWCVSEGTVRGDGKAVALMMVSISGEVLQQGWDSVA